MVDLVVKTQRGLETVTASAIREVLGDVKVVPRPHGFLGLVLVDLGGGDRRAAAERVLKEVPEAEKVFAVEAEVPADLERIAAAAASLARARIGPHETFAVRTTRRGSHPFTSIDVNRRVGDAVREATGARVDLTSPDKVLLVEIVGDRAYLSVTGGWVEFRKDYLHKPDARAILSRVRVAQVPYLGDLEAARRFGIRIGRAAQTLEIAELYVTPYRPVDARELGEFLRGLEEGIESRYRIQTRTYPRRVRRVPVYVQDLYQFVRERRGEPMVATSTRGRPLAEVGGRLRDLFGKGTVNVLIGSREGLPSGVLRLSDLVVDVVPGVTLATDLALTGCLMAILTHLLGDRRAFQKWARV